MQTLLLTLLILATPAFAQGAWRLKSESDAMTDKVKQSATTVNSQGHELSVYRGPKDAAWVLFSVGKNTGDTLSPKQAPAFRIDKLQPHDLENTRQLTEKRIGLDTYRWEPRWINFVVWHGKESEGRSTALKELMSGQTVVFRYYIFTGGHKETSFSLEGAAPVIARALGISVAADSATESAAAEYKARFLAASTRCEQDMRTFATCFERVSACEKKAQRDLNAMQKCLPK